MCKFCMYNNIKSSEQIQTFAWLEKRFCIQIRLSYYKERKFNKIGKEQQMQFKEQTAKRYYVQYYI